jgi:signal transduction histidine kinase
VKCTPQTLLFEVLCAFAMAGVIGVLLWMRVRQASSWLRDRHEALLAERDRIARDLHDTLLQSTEGLILKVYTAAQQLPPGDPIREFLARSLDQAEELAIEARQKLLGLRDPLRSRLELSQALATLGLELAADTTTTFSAVQNGRVRALTATAWDEIFGIAREAIVNAIKHSNGQHIEAVVTYSSSNLTVQIRDDGRGMHQNGNEDAGAEDHFGLRGMRERAAELRAALKIETADGAGTTVSLVVPSKVAFRRRFIDRMEALM